MNDKELDQILRKSLRPEVSEGGSLCQLYTGRSVISGILAGDRKDPWNLSFEFYLIAEWRK